jgi:hypothetical protein
MSGTSATSSTPVAESPRLLIGLCNGMALGTLFWAVCWWLIT